MKANLNTIIIASAVIISAYFLSNAFRSRNRASNAISVTGLGSKDFVSDLIVWSGTFSKNEMNLKDAYAALDHDREKIRKYLTDKGINPSQVVFSAVTIEKLFNEVFDDSGNKKMSEFAGYNLKQEVQVESKEVDKVEGISREITELINSGVEFYSNQPQYFYTKLSELKIQMIAEATKDAKIRADKIAENAGSDIGSLKKAEMGVFQIVGQNSTEDYSWGGTFNTSSKRKTASITVKLDYNTH
jgi:hypothetical protein